VEAQVRLAVATLGLVLGCVAIVNAQEPQVQPTPGTADAPPERTLKLNLNDLLELQQERGHAEFDTALRRELWKDPMIRLAIGISREQAATARGGLVGYRGPWSAANLLVTMPGVEPRLVLAGPFASDWRDLTTGEKIGRATEGVVYLGLIAGILSSLH
jgi:hypothetical protein